MKTITISDEVYEKLERLKGRRSFSELLDYLIKANVDLRIDRLLELSGGRGREVELEKIVESIRKGFRVRLFETNPGHQLPDSA